jgi:hypothetical protein
MRQDFEEIPAVAKAAIGKCGDELTFPFPEILEVIDLCTRNRIAVLGVEVFLVKNNGYHAWGCSDYDIGITRKWRTVSAIDWDEYVNENNKLAEEGVRRRPVGDDHVYILTTTSLNEHAALQELKKLRK